MTEDSRDWRAIYHASRLNRWWFKRGIIVYDVLDAALMLWAIVHGAPRLAALAEFLASQIPLFVVGGLWERRNPVKALNPKTQSWAFLADYVGLAPLAWVAASAWPTLPKGGLFTGPLQPLWVLVAVAAGIFASLSFRKGEATTFDVLRYYSYTKMLHNGVAFAVLSSFVVYIMPRLLITGTWSGRGFYPELALGFLAIWVTGALADGRRAHLREGHPLRLDARNLHPQADEHGRSIVPEIQGVKTLVQLREEEQGQTPPKRFGWWGNLLHTRTWRGRK